jgi:hypothetical protein
MKIFFLLFILTLPLAGFSQEEDVDIVDLEEHREKQQELVEKLTLEKKKAPSSDVPEELRSLGHESLSASTLMDERVISYYQKILRNNPLMNEPRANVEKLILERTKNSIIHPFLIDNPKILSCFAQILQDKNAMADMLGIFLRQGSLKLYMIISLIFLVMTWLLKRIVLNEDWARWKYVISSLTITLLMVGVNLATFFKIFKKELFAVVMIIAKNF